MPVLANAYIDLGNWYGVTPYVGAGAGFAWMRTSGALGYLQNGNASWVAYQTERQTTSPAFAAMAGLSVDLGSGFQLDAGYRYLWVTSNSGPAFTTVAGATAPTNLDLRNTGFHQARVGLRWFVF